MLRFFRSPFTRNAFPVLGAALLLSLSACGEKKTESDGNIVLGTGGDKGNYYPAGAALCEAVKAGGDITCEAKETDGSISNLVKLRMKGQLDAGIARSDWLYSAYNGDGAFKKAGPDTGLREVAALYAEPVVIAAREKSGISSVDDLKGRRINIGTRGTSSALAAEALMQVKGWTEDDFKLVSEQGGVERGRLFCRRKIDAVIAAGAGIDRDLSEAAKMCPMRIIALSAEEVKAITGSYPYFSAATLRGGLYSGNDDAVPTVGLRALVVASAATPASEAAALLNGLLTGLENIKKAHPLLAELTTESVRPSGAVAPLHPGVQ